MKLLRCLFVSLLLCGSAIAAPAFVRQCAASVTGDVGGCAFSVGPAAGNSIIAIVSHTSAETTSYVRINPSATNLTQAGSTVSVAGVKVEIWYIHNIPSGVTAVEMDTNLETRENLNASEWSGLNNAGPEASNSNTAVASSTVTTNSVTPGSANNVVIAIGAWTANDYSSGPTNSFIRTTQTGGGAAFQEGAYLIQSSAAAQSTGWTLTAGINWAAAITVFGAPASGPTNSQRSAGFFAGPP